MKKEIFEEIKKSLIRIGLKIASELCYQLGEMFDRMTLNHEAKEKTKKTDNPLITDIEDESIK